MGLALPGMGDVGGVPPGPISPAPPSMGGGATGMPGQMEALMSLVQSLSVSPMTEFKVPLDQAQSIVGSMMGPMRTRNQKVYTLLMNAQRALVSAQAEIEKLGSTGMGPPGGIPQLGAGGAGGLAIGPPSGPTL